MLDFRGFEAGAVFFLEVFAVPLMGCIARDLVFDEFLDIAEEIDFVLGAEGDGKAIGSGPSRAADAVDVGFGFVREVVVYDETDVFYIDPTCRDIGGD